MAEIRLCPECGSELPSDAPDTPCPVCLMKLGLESWSQKIGEKDDLPETETPTPGRFEAPRPDELGEQFPQLEVLKLLGQGGMGAVYVARQVSLDRLVALKIIKPDAADDPGFAERFTREAKSLARLNHPNIVTVHDFGQTDGLYYFVMELVDGVNLRQMLEAGDLEPSRALAIVPHLCDALQYAHDEGIVHRDVKPENILIDKKGRVKIADFGLAKLIGERPGEFTLTGTHQVMGTPRYMAPEQMEGSHHVDHRADIYSLGVVFYEMLTGELPLGRFQPPSKKVQVDVRLDEVVLRALEKEPQQRYQNANDVKTAIERLSVNNALAQRDIDDAPSQITSDEQRSATQHVKGPATWLLVTGILNWIGMPIAVGILTLTDLRDKHPIPEEALASLAIVMFLVAGLILFGALKMKRMESYRFALVASVLALVITPGNVIGFPIGIWSLVVLSSKEVKEAFPSRRKTNR